MNMYKQKFTRLQNQIIRLLCVKVGAQLNQREIAKILKVSPTAVAKSLHLLEEDKLIKLQKLGTMNLKLVELNRDNVKSIFLKRTENLKMIYESGIVEFLYESFPGGVIILFGSYSKGEDTIKSDIDIAIIGSKEKHLDLEEFERKLGRLINLNFYDSINSIDKYLKSNIVNGIVLVGSIEL